MDITAALNQAILAAKAGRKAEARSLLEAVLNADERNEQAWLWLSGVVDDAEERVICLENVLIINPGNQAARQGLAALQATPAAGQPAAPGTPAAVGERPSMTDEPQAPAPQQAPSLESTSGPARSRPPIADKRVFIVITVVLVLLLICTVISILAIVTLSPTG
jgi:hypothetical protein